MSAPLGQICTVEMPWTRLQEAMQPDRIAADRLALAFTNRLGVEKRRDDDGEGC